MKDGFNKQKWTTAAGASAASFLEKWLRDKFDEAMHSMIDAHPITKRFLQMFFDSDLDSEIEKNAYMAITDAIISTVEELTKDGPLSKFHDVIVPIVHFVCKRLFLLKLAYHANAGRISKEQFCERAAEHLAVETAAFVEKAWNIVPLMLEKGKIGLVGVLVYWGMDPALAEHTADKISNFLLYLYPVVKKFLTKDNIQKLLIRTIEICIDASRFVLMYTEKLSNKVKHLYEMVENKLKSWGRSICRTLRWAVPDFLKEEDHPLNEAKDSKSNLSATINHVESKEPTKKTNPMASKNPFEKNNPAESKNPFRKVDQSKGSQTTITVEK